MMRPTAQELAELARLVAATVPREIDCDAVLDRIGAYLVTLDQDRELSAQLMAVRQHLQVCPECREEFDALVRSSQLAK